MKKISCITLFLLIFSFTSQVFASYKGRENYEKAVGHARQKEYDFAFMELRALIHTFPESTYACEALFGLGEYFYLNNIYNEAIEMFSEYVKKYPDSKPAVFAKAYLLKIIEDMKKPTAGQKGSAESLKKDFFSTPKFFMFSEYKEFSYKSVFQNNFKIRYYVDEIEIYRNGELFIKITQ